MTTPNDILTKHKLKTFTLADIRKWEPCYDPAKYAPENWKGTAIDVLKAKQIPAEDRLWVVLREEVIGARTARLFGCWCARQALKLVEKPDPRSVNAIEVSERYANGEATKKELAAARDAAWDAAGAAARAAAWAAAGAAARAAARDAAWDAAGAAQIKHLIEMLEE